MPTETNYLTSSPYKAIIRDYFDRSFDFEFLDVIAQVLSRIDEDDMHDETAILDTIWSTVIYTYDEWLVLKHYCTPLDADWNVASESLENDILAIVAIINKQANA